jgi:hypothetical protein
MGGILVDDWFRQPSKYSKGSIVWKALVSSFPLVDQWTMWKIKDGRSVPIGEDPWVGDGNEF